MSRANQLRIMVVALTMGLPLFSQTNLLRNSGFEEGQGNLTAVWEPAKSAGAKGQVERSERNAHSGRFSLRIAPNSNNRGSSITDDPIGAGQGLPGMSLLGKRLVVSAWLAASGGATATVAAYAIGRGGPRFVELNQESGGGGPVQHSAQLEIPSKDVDFVVVLCLAKGASGEVFIDDVSLSAGAPAPVARASAASSRPSATGVASIRVDATRVIRQIPRELYGTNLEWVWDANGIWDAPADRLNQQVAALTAELKPSLLRFPGGIFADFYHWRDGIGPRDQRKQTAHSPSGGESVHRFGTDEALAFADLVGAQLLITVNAGTGTAEEAAEWVRYVNASGRRVTYWEVGNEIYVKDNSPHSMASTMSPQAYAAKFIEFSRAMKAADPGIKVGALGEENYGNSFKSYQNWTEIVLEAAAADMDFIAVHNGYAPAIISEDSLTTEAVYRAMLAAPAQIAENLEGLSRKIGQLPPEHADRIKIAVTEWGPYFQVTPNGKWVDHPKTLASALYVASALKAFLEQPRMEIANAFKLVDPLFMGWIGKRGREFVPQASFLATQMFTRHFASQLLETHTQSPGFDSPAVGWVRAARDVPYLDALASRDPAGQTIHLMVINKNLTNPVAALIDVAGANIAGKARIWTVNGKSPDANTGSELFQGTGIAWARQAEYERGGRFSKGGPDEVKMMEGELGVDGQFQYTFPAHSITTIELPVR